MKILYCLLGFLAMVGIGITLLWSLIDKYDDDYDKDELNSW